MQMLSDDMNTFALNLPRTLEVLIIPNVVKVDAKFGKLSLSHRNCYMKNERKLKFFKIYSLRNCQIECLSEKMLTSCGCVTFDVIRSNDTKICELFDYTCISKVKNETLFEDNSCNCLHPCSYTSYNLETVNNKHAGNSTDGIIKIKFKENEFILMQRVQQFTIFDFLSYIGGLLGLFAGISVLSIFEIFYFFTLRFICEIMMVRRGEMKVEGQNSIIIVAPKVVECHQ
jgi:amiloride-sensitive sodium channel